MILASQTWKLTPNNLKEDKAINKKLNNNKNSKEI